MKKWTKRTINSLLKNNRKKWKKKRCWIKMLKNKQQQSSKDKIVIYKKNKINYNSRVI